MNNINDVMNDIVNGINDIMKDINDIMNDIMNEINDKKAALLISQTAYLFTIQSYTHSLFSNFRLNSLFSYLFGTGKNVLNFSCITFSKQIVKLLHKSR